MSEIQAPPFCVQIEPTEGCPLMCKFCGIHGIRQKAGDYKFMSVELAKDIAKQMAKLGWNSRVEFAMHGEPSVNPKLFDIVAAFREELPKAYLLLETNGSGLLDNPVGFTWDMKSAGLNCLAVDEYAGCSWAKDFFDELESNGMKYYDYPKDKEGNPHQRKTGFCVTRVRPITAALGGTHATLNNHCGCGAPLDFSMAGKRCAKPFREMSIRWDGGISICCNDWRGIIKAGSAQEGLDQVWNGPVFQASRRILLEGKRDKIKICHGCNASSYRPGLLPDLKGQVELSDSTQSDYDMLARVAWARTMAPTITRPWEVKP